VCLLYKAFQTWCSDRLWYILCSPFIIKIHKILCT
jgi:hypothetical protein